jgi:hypothetical protein
VIGFRYAGLDADQKCLTCKHWRMQEARLKGTGKCAAATGIQDRHSHFGPHAMCDLFSKAHPTAITKRKALL